MNIQGLAVMAIVILLPISLVLSSYCSNQIKTLDYQISYDNKLTTATYDGVKSFQLNLQQLTSLSSEDVRIRDIEAAINTFYTSLANQLQMTGYGQDVLKDYVPAIGYTLYDGYYIFSEYENTLPVKENESEEEASGIHGLHFYYDDDNPDIDDDEIKYKRYSDPTNPDPNPPLPHSTNELLNGLKPYIYYSCRYKRENGTGSDNFDVVITYTLDSYITIQGTIGNEAVNESGYLLSGVTKDGDEYEYRGIEILPFEEIRQNVLWREDQYVPLNSDTRYYRYRKVNGSKFYLEDFDNNTVYSLGQNYTKTPTRYSPDIIIQNDAGKEYYEKAFDFKERFNNPADLLYKLRDLKIGDAVDQYGKRYFDASTDAYPNQEDNPFVGMDASTEIFSELSNTATSGDSYIEDEGSVFNQHRRDVIKYAVESNLRSAIRSFNVMQQSQVGVNFSMPKLTDEDWDTVANNVTMITFLQGLNIGGKIYNGYAVVPNNVNEQFVSEDSIYLIYENENESKYYKITDPQFDTSTFDIYDIGNHFVGALSVDFERKSIETSKTGAEDSEFTYFYPLHQLGSYTSIIESNSHNRLTEDFRFGTANVVKNYISAGLTENEKEYVLLQKYYTALGRERVGMARGKFTPYNTYNE